MQKDTKKKNLHDQYSEEELKNLGIFLKKNNKQVKKKLKEEKTD